MEMNQARQQLMKMTGYYDVIAIFCIISGITTLLLPSLAIGQILVGGLILVYHISIRSKLKKKMREEEGETI